METRACRTAVGTDSAAAFIAGLAAQDFAALRAALAADVRLRALLPGGLWEWSGADAVADRFERWFGRTEQFVAVDGGSGEVEGRVQLRWRLRLRAARLGPGWFVVEQVAYCDTDAHGRICRIDLLCTGYRPEGSNG